MDAHRRILATLCRLCGSKFREKAKIKAKHKIQRDLQQCLSINIKDDNDNIHPQYLCPSCSMKMSRWRNNMNSKKTANVPVITQFQFTVHTDNCKLCLDDQWDLENIQKMCEGKKVFSWITEDRLVCVIHDNLGEQVVKRIVFQGKGCKVYLLGREVSLQEQSPSELVNFVKTLTVCQGNSNFPEIAQENKDGLRGVSGELVATVEEQYFDGTFMVNCQTIRHCKCEYIANPTSGLCSVCSIYKGTLHSKEKKGTGKGKGKRTRHDYLSKEELSQRVKELSYEKKLLTQKNTLLKVKIENVMKEEGMNLAEDDNNVVEDLVSECEAELERILPENSHCQLLWKEQLKARNTSSKQMRWHPAIIKWAIAIHSKSASAYNVLRNSGFIRLPHANTLYNYTHFSDPRTGINHELLNFYIQDLKLFERPKHECQVNLIFDEMKIQAGLAFSVKTGRIVGFVDVGDVPMQMDAFEKRCTEGASKDEAESLNVASHCLLFMARGITSNIKFPVAYFGTNNVTSTQLYPVVMDCIETLHIMGMEVKCLTSDGAASNRKLYEIMAGGKKEGVPQFKTKNYYTKDKSIFFICDVPHLMKTTRNNFENSGWNRNTKKLMINGKRIAWTQLLQLNEWDQGGHRAAPGLQLVPKLTYEHLHLTPSLRMKVKLAVQVLSSTVANALEAMHKPELESTITFIRMMDRCFDMLNVSNQHAWLKKRKDDLKPYTSLDDPRLKWLIDDFVGFLSKWRAEAEAIPELTKKEKQKLCLSKETCDGFFISVNSFVEVTKELLQMDGVKYILSDKLNQDPIEEFFGKQRGAGGFHDNPSMQQFGHHMLQNIVAGSRAVASSKGNVRVGESSVEGVIEEPLPKKKRTQHSK